MSTAYDPWARLAALFPSFADIATREDLTSRSHAYAKDVSLGAMQFMTIEVLVLMFAELRVHREQANRQIEQLASVHEDLRALVAVLSEHAPAQTDALRGLVERLDAVLAAAAAEMGAPDEAEAPAASPASEGDGSTQPGGDASPLQARDDIDDLLIVDEVSNG